MGRGIWGCCVTTVGRVPGKHFGLRVVKPLLGTPGRGHNSRPKYWANGESVPLPFTLDEAIFEVASEAHLEINVS